MTNLAVTNDLFFERTGMDPRRIDTLVGEALAGMDDGELFLEYSQSESVALDDGRIKSASFDTTQGFGLRAVSGEAAGYAHASEISEAAIRRAAAAVRAVASGHAGTIADPPPGTNRALYTDLNPLGIVDLAAKTRIQLSMSATFLMFATKFGEAPLFAASTSEYTLVKSFAETGVRRTR